MKSHQKKCPVHYLSPLFASFHLCSVKTVVLIIYSSSEHIVHTWSKSGISICWRHLVTAKESSDVFYKILILLPTCAICSELPSNKSTRVMTVPTSLGANLRALRLRAVCFTIGTPVRLNIRVNGFFIVIGFTQW